MTHVVTDVDIVDAMIKRALSMSKKQANQCVDTKHIILLLEQTMLYVKMREEARKRKG